MAALASSAVSFYPTSLSSSDFVLQNQRFTVHRLKLVLTGQGGLTNTIGFAALGMSIIVFATSLWDATNSVGYAVAIDPVNSLLVLLDGAAAPAPVDVTSSAAYITLIGVSKTTPG